MSKLLPVSLAVALSLLAAPALADLAPPPPPAPHSGCSAASAPSGTLGGIMLALGAAAFVVTRRRRSNG